MPRALAQSCLVITVDETSADAREAPRPDSDPASAPETSPDAAAAVHDDVSSEPLREELTASTALALVARTVRSASLPLAGVLFASSALWTIVYQLKWSVQREIDTTRGGVLVLGGALLMVASWLASAAITSMTIAIVMQVARDRRPELGEAARRGLARGFVPQLRLVTTTTLGVMFCLLPGLFVLAEHYAVGAVAIARDVPRSVAWPESKRLTHHRRGLVFALAIVPGMLRIVGNNWALPGIETLLWALPLPDIAIAALGNAMYATFQMSTFVLEGLLSGAVGAVALGVGTEGPRGSSLAATFE